MSKISLGRKSAFGAVLSAAIAVIALPSSAVAAVEGDRATNPAGGPPAGLACSTDGWVKTCFQPRGDVIWVKDTKKDGYPARVYFWGGGTGDADEKKSCLNMHGAAAGWTRCTGLSKMIPENTQIIMWPMEVYGKDYNHFLPKSGGTQLVAHTS